MRPLFGYLGNEQRERLETYWALAQRLGEHALQISVKSDEGFRSYDGLIMRVASSHFQNTVQKKFSPMILRLEFCL